MAGRKSVLLEIALVVLFGAPERGRGLDARYDRAFEAAGERFFFCARGTLLLGRVNEDHRAVLRPRIRSLTVQLGRIVILKKNIEQLLIGNSLWIEGHLHHFGMS